MPNPFGVTLDPAAARWAIAEGVSENVIAAIYLLQERSVDEIVAKLRPGGLEQVIKLVGRCPSCYPHETLDALKSHRQVPPPEPAASTSTECEACCRRTMLPMFNQDLEGNLPEEAVRFKSELAKAVGILIVTPEHDRSIPALLKNAVDWGARPYGKNSWAGKPGFITGTSPGAIGSALAQQHLRSVMVGLGTLQGGEAYVTFKPNLVDDDGNIGDESTRKFLQGFLDKFASLVVRLSPQATAS
jgi:chromate reductase, NAD(P)H dehydrogenase (quinone)